MNLADVQAAVGLTTPIRHQLFIDGRFVDAESGETQVTLNPHDNTPIVEVAMAGHADVDKAVAAARRAFPVWSRMAAADRGRILLRLADLIERGDRNGARAGTSAFSPTTATQIDTIATGRASAPAARSSAGRYNVFATCSSPATA